jgi:prolyl-tRNA synthetase
MLRAGLIRQLGSGLYTYLPLGWRALHKTIEIVRDEMNAAGAAEILMPALEPIELFADTKRDVEYGENLFRLTDRHGRHAALAPTHEEIITEFMAAYVESYRQLPLNLYQIQTKYRDEFRPRFGVLRSREFIMKDAYSFDLTVDGLDTSYQAMYDAYCRIFDRCGLTYDIVEAESGPIGGSASHEFMVLCNTGEDTILKSDKGNYAANIDKCAIGERAWTFDGPPTGDLEKIHTPDCASIEAVGKFMKVKPKHLLKTLIYSTDNGPVIAVVRGDHDVNESKLQAACGFAVSLDNEACAKRYPIGFIGPHLAAAHDELNVVVDCDAAQEQFWASGANEIDHHVKHFNWKRDVLDHIDESRIKVADIRNAADGDPSPTGDGGVLREHRGIEVGHVFKLGTKYSDAMGFTVLDEDQKQRSVIMGCYGIGLGRIVAAAIEIGHDADGIIWPASIAPYSVHIVPIKYEGELCKTCQSLAQQLEGAGMDVLIDDRPERPGVKFNDADLIGCPIRLTIGEKGLAQNSVEFKRRAEGKAKATLVHLDEVVQRCREALGK